MSGTSDRGGVRLPGALSAHRPYSGCRPAASRLQQRCQGLCPALCVRRPPA